MAQREYRSTHDAKMVIFADGSCRVYLAFSHGVWKDIPRREAADMLRAARAAKIVRRTK